MVDHNSMSDSQIAAAIFECICGGIPDFRETEDGGITLLKYEHDIFDGEDVEVVVECGRFNPCHNISDMWPLMIEKRISLNMETGGMYAYKGEKFDWEGLVVGFDYYCEHINPLRAAAIVYLMVEGKVE